ncbi:MAG: hypothetical protein HYT62_03615 [Candidatus Yanofskybacteria bacterium]|nr:hypothetical protein [Candidatus Yanofskybacteria bacterium]
MRRVIFVLLFCLGMAGYAYADKPKILKLSELKPGTTAVGFSVFRGIEPEPFDVVLGGTVDQMGNSFILARISGGPMETPLEKVGAVSGMSGSPIFTGCAKGKSASEEKLADCIKNGFLVGALSYGPGSFIQGGPNVLLTPIEYMLGSRVGGYVIADQHSSRVPNRIHIGDREFSNLMLAPKMDNLATSSGSVGKCDNSARSELKPGSMVTVFLAKGSIPFGGSGTVTWRDGDKIYIFGHPFYGTGMVKYPFVHVAVADVIQTPINAYKMPGCYLDTEGTMLVDGAFEMAGLVGKLEPGLPMRVELHLGIENDTLNEEIFPSPLARMIINKLPGAWAGQLVGNLNPLSLAYQIRVAIQDESEIFLKSIIPVGMQKNPEGPKNPFEELFNRLDYILAGLGETGLDYKIEGIRVHIDLTNDLKVWSSKKVFLSQDKANPGETIYASVILSEGSSGAIRQMNIPIKIPVDFMERVKREEILPSVRISLQGGSRFIDRRELKEIASVEDFIKQLNQSMNHRANVLYVQQILSKPHIEQKAEEADAKVPVGPEWQWAEMKRGELRQLLSKDQDEVILTLSPELDDFIDLDEDLNFTVEAKDVPVVVDKPEPKKKKRFGIF